MSKKSICLVATAHYTIEVFLLDQIKKLSEVYSVTVVLKATDPDFLTRRGIKANVIFAPIERKISLINDVRALYFLIKFFF